MDGDDWDLQAVVRGCCFRGKPAEKKAVADPVTSFPSSLPTEERKRETDAMFFPDLSSTRSGVLELEELCKPFFSKPQQQQQQQQHQPPLLHFSPLRSNPSSPSSSAVAAGVDVVEPTVRVQRQPHRPLPQITRSKRRKNQQKKVVCNVPADGVSSDMWAWRKYGQKPIKGSPYPRGYYRCSSSKGCLARKQVERSRTDPGMFIITYTAEHNHPVPNHRNSLAGSTRHKFPSPPPTSGGDGEQPLPSSPPSSSTLAVLSPTTPLTASSMEEEEEEEELLVEDMEVIGEDELLFMGDTSTNSATSLEAVAAANSAFFDDDDGFDERFFAPPWLANNNAAAAAGGS